MSPPDRFPPGFFDRADPSADTEFYASPRLVNHLDDGAIAAVGSLYEQLGLTGDVLDLMSSWVSHFREPPASLTVLGLNRAELEANPAASVRTVRDLNADPTLPYPDSSFDAVVNCVSIDYLTDPVAVLSEVARVLRPGGLSVCTFSNRMFHTKAVRGWLAAAEAERPGLVAAYHQATGLFVPATTDQRVRGGWRSDPLWAVWAARL